MRNGRLLWCCWVRIGGALLRMRHCTLPGLWVERSIRNVLQVLDPVGFGPRPRLDCIAGASPLEADFRLAHALTAEGKIPPCWCVHIVFAAQNRAMLRCSRESSRLESSGPTMSCQFKICCVCVCIKAGVRWPRLFCTPLGGHEKCAGQFMQILQGGADLQLQGLQSSCACENSALSTSCNLEERPLWIIEPQVPRLWWSRIRWSPSPRSSIQMSPTRKRGMAW